MKDLAIPILEKLDAARNVLVAGAGGGYDVYSGLPIYFALRAAGKRAHLANLSFAALPRDGHWLASALTEVTADASGSEIYFPERFLARWLADQGEEVPVYAFDRTGVRPIADGYAVLADHLGIEAVVLVDGGTDSLMRGDEFDLATPEEDIASLLAVDALSLERSYLLCVGFGVDAFHGICHAQFLEAVAELTRDGAFLGAFSMTADMPAVRRYREATEAVLQRVTPGEESIVCGSILSAMEGRFGNYHRTPRTAGSRLWINPLMTLYWAFALPAVARRLLYRDAVIDTESYADLCAAIARFRGSADVRPYDSIPV